MAFLYELPTGKTIILSTLSQVLNIDIQKEIAEDRGKIITNPFFDVAEVPIEEFNIDLPDLSDIEEIPLDYTEED